MKNKTASTFAHTHPNEILSALVGLKDIRVLSYERHGRDVALKIEQVLGDLSYKDCGHRARIKERPEVAYVDLPVYVGPQCRSGGRSTGWFVPIRSVLGEPGPRATTASPPRDACSRRG